MNCRTMIAALTVISAASLALAPVYAQQSLLDTKMGAESAPKTSGALPAPSLRLGAKGTATTEDGKQPAGGAKPLSPSTAAPNLPVK